MWPAYRAILSAAIPAARFLTTLQISYAIVMHDFSFLA